MEKGNRKGKSQKTHSNQKPAKKVRIAKVYIMPDKKYKIDVDTGEVSDVEMVQFLRDLTKHFAKRLIDDATDVVGDSLEEQEKYLDWRIKKSGLGNS